MKRAVSENDGGFVVAIFFALMVIIVSMVTMLIYDSYITRKSYESPDVLAAQEKLLPCPWCGSSNVKFAHGVAIGVWQPRVECQDCNASEGKVKESDTWTLEEAVNFWNSIERK